MSTTKQQPMYATTDSTSEAQQAPRPHDAYRAVREQTVALCAPLEREDFVVQSMPDASPAKWHLAHTTWFFERFVLREAFPELAPYDERYDYIFNSYYDSVGARHARAERGLLTRPTVDEILGYRRCVDERMCGLLDSAAVDAVLLTRIELGVHHEQQHQELLLTDIKHAFSLNPLEPAYARATPHCVASVAPLAWHRFGEGLHEIGAAPGAFCFDNETPRHRVHVHSFALALRPILRRWPALLRHSTSMATSMPGAAKSSTGIIRRHALLLPDWHRKPKTSSRSTTGHYSIRQSPPCLISRIRSCTRLCTK